MPLTTIIPDVPDLASDANRSTEAHPSDPHASNHMWYDPGIQMVSEMNLPRPAVWVAQMNRLPSETADAWHTSAYSKDHKFVWSSTVFLFT